jgi:protein-disulfide isomerase
MFPFIKQNYIDTGKVYYVFRVFPLSQVDIAAESMARCLPKENYFQFIDLLFRNQPKWDPDGYPIADVHGALVDMGKIAGMSADQVDKCINDQAAQKRAGDVGSYAQATYGINGTPTFIVNGQIAPPFESTDTIKKYLDALLAKK